LARANEKGGFPTKARLQNGEQLVVLEGDLAVGIAFSEVASIPIATLRINHDRMEEVKALPLAGNAFPVSVRGQEYRISVVRLSMEAKEIDLRIDQVK
jgi:hypothetical protein